MKSEHFVRSSLCRKTLCTADTHEIQYAEVHRAANRKWGKFSLSPLLLVLFLSFICRRTLSEQKFIQNFSALKIYFHFIVSFRVFFFSVAQNEQIGELFISGRHFNSWLCISSQWWIVSWRQPGLCMDLNKFFVRSGNSLWCTFPVFTLSSLNTQTHAHTLIHKMVGIRWPHNSSSIFSEDERCELMTWPFIIRLNFINLFFALVRLSSVSRKTVWRRTSSVSYRLRRPGIFTSRYYSR